jgi:hypothetical protein
MTTFKFGNADGISDFAASGSQDTFIFGNGDSDFLILGGLGVGPQNFNSDTVIFGNGDHDRVLAASFEQNADNPVFNTTIMMGNGAGDNVEVGDFTQGTIKLGDGVGDQVATDNRAVGNTIILGNGADDSVSEFGSNNTIVLGNGDGDMVSVGPDGGQGDHITLGNGNGDGVNVFPHPQFLVQLEITLGNGNGDTVQATDTQNAVIKVGNGNDTIFVGQSSTVTVGTGQDTFIFNQASLGLFIGDAVTINGFDPSKDVLQLPLAVQNTYSAQDDVHGNAVIKFQGDTKDSITLVGVHSSALHASDFHFA